jgi:hypothetical protein
LDSPVLLHAALGELHGRPGSFKVAAAPVGYAGSGVVRLLARWFTEPSAAKTRNQ